MSRSARSMAARRRRRIDAWLVVGAAVLVAVVAFAVAALSGGERIARLRNYFYTPEIIAEVCAELDMPCRINGTFRARGAA